MGLVEQIMRGALQEGRYVSSGQTRVEYAERFWRENPYHAVEEGDWRFPGATSGFWSSQKTQSTRNGEAPMYLKIGRRPNRATKTVKEMHRTAMSVFRTAPMAET